jgi:FixJ family two-component response regulator
VEDLESPRDIICVYLESLGFNDVSGVASAGEALALLEENPTKFSCVVTDIRMPQVSGAELIKKLRSDKRFSSLPIVVLTAYGTVDCLLDCLRNGASGFLVKPPKKSDMIREMGRAIRIRESGRHARLASAEEVEYVHDLLEKRGLETE